MSRGNLLLIICFVAAQFATSETTATIATVSNLSWVQASSNSNIHQLLPRDAPSVGLINYIAKIVCSLKTPLIYYYYKLDMVNCLEDSILRVIHQCSVAPIRAGTFCRKAMPADGKLVHMIIMLKSLMEIDTVLTVIDRHSAAKEQSHFIILIEIILDDKLASSTQKIKAFFESFWKTKRVLNAILVFVNKDDKIKTISFNPFFRDYYIVLPSESIKSSILFPEKLFNLNNYKINVTLFADQNRMKFIPKTFSSIDGIHGIDGMFMRHVSKLMNANFSFILENEKNHPNGDFFPNGSVSGVLKKIINNDAEISFNSRFYRFVDFRNRLEPSIVVGRDDICFFVPKVTKIEYNPSNLALAFSGFVWILLFGLLFGGTTFLLALEKLEGTKQDSSAHLLNLWRIMLLQNLPGISKNSSIRMFLGFWMLYTLLMSNCYSGDLVSQLVSPEKVKQINDIATLASKGFKIVAEDYYVTFFEKNMNGSKEYGSFKDSMMRVKGREEVLEQIGKQQPGVAFLSKRNEIDHYLKKKVTFTKKGEQFYHLVGECAVPNYLTYIVQYGSPYLSRLNTILARLFESSIQDFWDDLHATHIYEPDEISFSMAQKMKSDNEVIAVEEKQKLRLQHLQTAFYLLIGGEILAAIFFLMEFLYHGFISYRLKQKKRVPKLTKRTVNFKTYII